MTLTIPETRRGSGFAGTGKSVTNHSKNLLLNMLRLVLPMIIVNHSDFEILFVIGNGRGVRISDSWRM